ncbi:MAG TPA: hypothetical protein VNJ07_01885 [Chitinophagales bacterium]|nr:hypothetical protein [Chitinophagales bacterium]
MSAYKIIEADSISYLSENRATEKVDLTFLDPPFNQNKDYNHFGRKSIGIEIDPINVQCIKDRIKAIRASDNIEKYYKDYGCTENLHEIWNIPAIHPISKSKSQTLNLFES